MPSIDVEQVKKSTDIIDIVSRYVDLRCSGKWHTGKCPFHEDTTPSFGVSREKQIYKCFACDAKGDVISFLRAYHGISFYDAITMITGDQSAWPLREKADLTEDEKRWVDIAMEFSILWGQCLQLQGEKSRARLAKGENILSARKNWVKAQQKQKPILASIKDALYRIDHINIMPPKLGDYPLLEASIPKESLCMLNGSDIYRMQILALCEEDS